ncbi:hypothetical protein FA13DRAFT_1796366 [Coprinellus micaceus]|uniref:Uncharacterized protein n=1 Tax=Coprinellus micaceus TaxID=71717 RepID=A0A4Y7SUC3_COPMI|nr:hypothetical protein FA13DRAFT_1796366 [Coprinellus micaceus]
MATLYLAQGDLETAFIQLTEAHAWVSRLAPRHPDHQTRLKEEERRSLAFHGKDMIWELQDLCVKIAQGLELPSTVSYDSADPELGTLIAGVSQEEVIALLSSPFDQAPVTVRRLFGAAAELDFSITRHESGQTVVGQEYLSRALVKRPGVSGWAPREVAIGRGQTPMVAVENAAREGYEVLRCLYFEWLD